MNRNRQRQQTRKQQREREKQKNKEKKRIIKNELEILNKIGNLPNELVDYIYLFLDRKIKYNLSYYFQLYKKYIINYNLNHHDCIYKDFKKFEYCTFDKTSSPLQDMLKEIPFDILRRYVYMGTPFKYFTIAFPEEGNIVDYLLLNYRITPTGKKNETNSF